VAGDGALVLLSSITLSGTMIGLAMLEYADRPGIDSGDPIDDAHADLVDCSVPRRAGVGGCWLDACARASRREGGAGGFRGRRDGAPRCQC